MNTASQQDLDKYPTATTAEFGSSVPVIDIGGLGSDPTDRAVAEIAQACRDWGFFQVVNHGVSENLIAAVWRQAPRFFRFPKEVKGSIRRTRENPWGYYDNELTKNQRDRKEVFDFTAEGTDPIYGSANRWPPLNGGFRDTMLEYLAVCTDLSLRLLEAFCVGLGLPRNHLHRHFVPGHTGFVRLNHYPADDPMTGSEIDYLRDADLGVHHHTDAGALTALLQDDVGGLQVYRDQCWHDVRPVEGAFVINTGDMMQVWSNDVYQAPIHRVLAMQHRSRCSIPFFFNPAAKTRVSPIRRGVSGTRPKAYRTINWKEFRSKRTDGDYADYGTEIQISQYRL